MGLGKSIRAIAAVLEVGILGNFEVQNKSVRIRKVLTLTWQWSGTQEDRMKYLTSAILSGRINTWWLLNPIRTKPTLYLPFQVTKSQFPVIKSHFGSYWKNRVNPSPHFTPSWPSSHNDIITHEASRRNSKARFPPLTQVRVSSPKQRLVSEPM